MPTPFVNKIIFQIFLVLIVAISINFVLYEIMDFRIAGDSTRYLTGAKALLAGHELDYRQRSYFGYVTFLAIPLYFGLDVSFAYLGQIFFQILSCLGAYFISKKFSQNPMINISCGLIWASFFYHGFWNFYILTDSLFASLLVILLSLGFYLDKKINILLFFTLAFLCATIRPNGFLLVIPVVLFQACRGSYQQKLAAITTALAILLVNPSSHMYLFHDLGPEKQKFSYMLVFTQMIQGEVIWRKTFVDMPELNFIPTGQLFYDYYQYLTNHFPAVINLYLHRLYQLFYNLNPFFSFKHKLVNILVLTPWHLLSLLGCFHALRRNQQLFFGSLLAIIIHICFVLVTHVDYDGRFLLYLTALQVPLFSIGFQALALKMSHYRLFSFVDIDKRRTISSKI